MDETGFIIAFNDPESLAQAMQQVTNVAALAAPTSQPDFNSAGSFDPKAILTSATQAVTSIAQAVGTVTGVKGAIEINQAAQKLQTQTALQQLAGLGRIDQLQTMTRVAEAQAAYNKAAGIGTVSPMLMLVLAVVGVGIGVFAFAKK